MKRLVLLLVLFPFSNFVQAQDLDHYYIEFKEGYEPQNLQKTVNTDQTLTLSMNNTSLAAALNEKPVYTFEKAFSKVLKLNVTKSLSYDNTGR